MSPMATMTLGIAVLLGGLACNAPHSHAEWEECSDPVAHGGEPEEKKEEDEHDHAGEQDAEDDHGDGHGHGHDPGAVAVTHWTEGTELFVEYPPLVANGQSAFAAHLTRTADFRPVDSGRVVVILTGGDAPEERFAVEKPDIPGIFRPVAAPRHAGKRQLAVALESGDEVDLHELGEVTVHVDEAAAHAAEASEEEGTEEGISFLKEQQWRIDFAMAEVAERTLHASVPASSARIVPRSDGQVLISAPIAGRLVTAGDEAPRIGLEVRQGQRLATIAPTLGGETDLPSLQLALSRAQVDVDHATASRERLEGLLENGAVSEKRLREARRDEDRARAELRAARRRLAQFQGLQRGAVSGKGGVRIAAPITGTVVEVGTQPGAFVEVGQELLRIVDLDGLWLEARVAEANLGLITEVDGAWFVLPGSDVAYEVTADQLVASGGLVDERTRTTPFLFAVDNPKRQLRAGMSVDAHIAVGRSVTGPTIPVGAIVRDGSQQMCFVQLDGESFAQRQLITGVREGGWIQVVSGVSPGERVVTRGAFAVKLAGSAGQVPSHGHIH